MKRKEIIAILTIALLVLSSSVVIGGIRNEPPEKEIIEIVNPREGYFHFSGIPLFPTVLNLFDDTVSFGGFGLRPIQVDTGGGPDSETIMVELFINGEYKGYGTLNPETWYHEWEWTERAFGTYAFQLIAVDMYGAVVDWAYFEVWNFCL